MMVRLSSLARRLRSGPDKEHEMSYNRIAIATLFVLILLWQGQAFLEPALLVMALYVALSAAIMAHLLVCPAPSPTRRFLALSLDTTCMSWQSYLGGEAVAAFFPIYLWITFGNGFRFGLEALRSATLVTAIGSGIVFLATPYWRTQSHLAIGLWISLIVLPSYAGTLIRRLSKARQEAEAASEAKTLFLANVSHELRTPLTAIIGMGRILQDTPLNTEQRDMSETVQSAARSLLALIDDLLKLSRIDAGRLQIDRVQFDLPQVLASIRQLLMVEAKSKELEVSVHVAADVPLVLVGGERQLREVLTNLVSNAVKFTEAGGVLIAVWVSMETEEGLRLRFEVADTGIGIAPAAKAHIFDTFTQADSTIAGRYGGTGLGLAISKRLATALGGSLQVESRLGHGSSFRLDVPFDAASDAPPLDVGGRDVFLLASDGVGKRHLLEQLARLAVSVTEIDPGAVSGQLEEAMQGWPGPGQLDVPPVLIVCVDGLGWAPRRVDDMLTQCRAIVGPHVVFYTEHEGSVAPCIRWTCASSIVGRASVRHLATALHIASKQEAALHMEPPLTAIRPLRILVAEDNRVNQKVLTQLLGRAGHAAVLVEDGEAALDTLEANLGQFDVVLMDVNMPRMDGLEATKHYRFMAIDLPHLPIIGLTADATGEMARRCLQAGMDACLTKPFDVLDLLATLQRLAAPGKPAKEGLPRPTPLTHRPPKAVRSTGAVLDEVLLQSLLTLGGNAFVDELVVEFKQEAGTLVNALRVAVQHDELEKTYAHVHTLHGISANVGAQALVELCKAWQNHSVAQLGVQAGEFTSRICGELARVEDAFRVRQLDHRRTPGPGR